MRRPVALACFVMLLVLPRHLPAQAPDVDARIRRIEQGLLTPVVISGREQGMRLSDRMQHYNVPGVSVAVIHDGRIDWARGWGVVSRGGAAVDTATLFQAASISKPVAAVAALRLVEQGRLDLDADVNTLLRSWSVPENGHTHTQRVTLRRLLSHNAGLTVHGFRGYADGEAVPTLVQLLQGASPANSRPVLPDTVPGALWRYSGGGSSVAQLLLEEVTAIPFPQLVREFVLEPAGMRRSGYEQPLPAARAAAAAVGHRSNGEQVTGRWHTYPEMFAAGLWTTPSDLARLALDVQSSYAGGPGILSPGMTRQMLTVQAGSYGLGFGVEQGDDWMIFSHGGANEGYRAFFLAFADRGQGAVVMTNGDGGNGLAFEVLRAIAREYRWPIQKPLVRDVVPIDAARLSEYAGEYTFTLNDAQHTLVIAVDEGWLRAVGRPFAGPRHLHYAGDDTFFLVESTATARFERDAAGAISGVSFPGLNLDIRAVRTPASSRSPQ
jgi:CubicO group peptidase (beta-lactamase class C family)